MKLYNNSTDIEFKELLTCNLNACQPTYSSDAHIIIKLVNKTGGE